MIEIKENQKLNDENVLVGRQEQIEQFNTLLKKLVYQSQSQHQALFEWYGGPGIGKTTLVKLLTRECINNHTSYAIINFREKQEQEVLRRYEQEPEFLLEELVSQLPIKDKIGEESYEKWQKAVAAFRSELSLLKNPVQLYFRMSRHERLYEQPKWLRQWREVVAAFLELIRGITGENTGLVQPVVFFFDETEFAALTLINWIEEWMINPLLRLQGSLVVWTARQPWRWKRPEVRQKLQSQQLLPFTPENVQQQLKAGKVDLAQELFSRVYQVTEGHPFAGGLAIQKIHKWQIDGEPVTANFIWDRRAALLQEIFGEFIENYAFRELAEDEQVALKLVALVRIFDNKMLQALLKKHCGNRFSDFSVEDTQELLMRLKRTQLLVWKKGHSLDPDLRHLIRNYYLTNEPQIFVAVNQTALEMNQIWLNKPVDNMNLFVIEELYHLASLLEAGHITNIKKTFQKRLNDYNKRGDDPEIRYSALYRLAGDLEEDKELKLLTNDLSVTILVEKVQSKIIQVQEELSQIQL